MDRLEVLAGGARPWAPGEREEDIDMERAAANPERTWCMSEVDIFADLNEAEMDAMAAAAPMKSYPASALIYTPHQPLEALFILKRGRIRIFRVSPDGRHSPPPSSTPGPAGRLRRHAEAVDDAASRHGRPGPAPSD